jgi:hypothetical protein
MASGKRIRAILWKYNYSTLYESTFVRCTYFRKYERRYEIKYEPEIIIRSTKVQLFYFRGSPKQDVYVYSVHVYSCVCNCTRTEVNICYEGNTTEVSYESIKESTCSCTTLYSTRTCTLLLASYGRRYFRTKVLPEILPEVRKYNYVRK